MLIAAFATFAILVLVWVLAPSNSVDCDEAAD
jgi:hypothetical protein